MTSLLRILLCLLPLGWLWFRLIDQLRAQWAVNPQYAYGWAVPFLCVYLIWRKAESGKSNAEKLKTETLKSGRDFSVSAFQLFSICLLSFLYLPIRLIQEANPEWSLVSWALALEVVGLTLLLLKAADYGPQDYETTDHPSRITHHASRFTFPICFFLVAVPWPYLIADPVIQGLTRLNTGLTIGILDWLDIPALQRGNVIELGTGEVGIDEACSGIRSLQATLMLSLFFGEFYGLRAWRRVLLVFSGVGLACVFNLGRTTLLTWVAARQGVDAISRWHDPAGVTILVGCFLGLWLVAKGLDKGKAEEPNAEILKAEMLKSEGRNQELEVRDFSVSAFQRFSVCPGFQLFSIFLIAWLVVVEVGVAGWYRHVEAGLPTQATWHVVWPVREAEFREIPIAPAAREMLRYDDAKQAQWTGSAGRRWQLSWFYWKPGRSAGYLAKSHNPLVCMPAAGYGVSSVSPAGFADINRLRFPFRIYTFEQEGNTISVLYSRWDDRAGEQSFGNEGVTRFNRLGSIWRGRGNQGQRVLSLAVWGPSAGQDAREQLLRQLREVLAEEVRS